jgi:hypothetical protein
MLRRWFIRWHGVGEAHQWDLYRCNSCSRLVTWNQIRKGSLCCARRIIPTNPTIFETFRLLVLPWTF